MAMFHTMLHRVARSTRAFLMSQWSSAGPLKLAAVGIALAVASAGSAFAVSRGAVPSPLGVGLMAVAGVVLPWAFVWGYVKHGNPPPAPEFQVQAVLVALGIGFVSPILGFDWPGVVP